MNNALYHLITRTRVLLLILIFLCIAGFVSYVNMPKEAQPDITIPIIYVSITHRGISPEDAERMLIRPMELKLRTIEGVKEMTASASLGYASVTLEFIAGFDSDRALADVREQVDLAKAKLPEGTDEPEVHEVNFSLFPVLAIGLSGDVPERTLIKLSKDLQDKLEGLAGVLEVTIAGNREDLLEILVKPEVFETYGLSIHEVVQLLTKNNKLVPAGDIDTESGLFSVKVPGVFETAVDVLKTPVKVSGDRVLLLSDLVTIRRTFEEPTSIAHLQGKPGIVLEVKKRTGVNIIETIEAVKNATQELAQNWPTTVKINFFQDNSTDIREMLKDLQNNLISAVGLVMLIVLILLGPRTATLVGISIPGSFLAGLFVLNLMGISINIVVLFSLILVVGMLVDGAIVVTEYADRKMSEGISPNDAYIQASQRMFWPIVCSTGTTLSAFMPMLYWPGIVGQFMRFLPITLIATLLASLVMALIFVPSLGRLFGKPNDQSDPLYKMLRGDGTHDWDHLPGWTGKYIRLLRRLLKHPWKIVLFAVLSLIGSYILYGRFGLGVEFFPDVEPERISVSMRTRGNLSLPQIDELLRSVESRLLDMKEFETVYARSFISAGGNNSGGFNGMDLPADTQGVVMLEFVDWKKRPKAKHIIQEAEKRLADLPGIVIEVAKERAGPPSGKPVSIEIRSFYPELLEGALSTLQAKFDTLPALKDISDTRPIPGIEWRVEIDREMASRFGGTIADAGEILQLATTGVKITTYRPEDAEEEVDIRLRFPREYRNINQLNAMQLPGPYGLTPLTHFTHQFPAPKVGSIKRTEGKRALKISADIKEGYLADDQVRLLRQWLETESPLDPGIQFQFKGEDEDQKESQAFLIKAFFVALGLIAIILVAQFNRLYYAFLILSAVIFSTVGVFLGLLITHQPFSVVMNGIGVIALAGIVVNNNIVLIDTFAVLRKTVGQQITTLETVLQTCAQRLRPVMLTTTTTILGLIPMVMGLNIDFLGCEITQGAPSTQWWSQLATSIAFGLAFATLLTLVLTPALLMLGEKLTKK